MNIIIIKQAEKLGLLRRQKHKETEQNCDNPVPPHIVPSAVNWLKRWHWRWMKGW